VRVFVTGATGLIGSALMDELTRHGHSILGLARSDGSARAIKAAGAEALPGALADLDVLRAGVAMADGVVHLAFANDFTGPEALAKAVAEESAALAALGDALVGSGRPLVTVSGTPLTPGRPSNEFDPLPTEGPVGGRGRAVNAVMALSAHGVRVSAIRLPRTVHNEGKGGFAGLLTAIARQRGISGYPGDGAQRWPAVHALDAATLFRMALEEAEAGTSWHAVADEGDRVRDIAAVIGRKLRLPTEPAADATFGPLAPIFLADQPSSSAYTQQTLGWRPQHPGLLDDLENLSSC
jgi:nucleoside-diphosphate-sugar epimerase